MFLVAYAMKALLFGTLRLIEYEVRCKLRRADFS